MDKINVDSKAKIIQQPTQNVTDAAQLIAQVFAAVGATLFAQASQGKTLTSAPRLGDAPNWPWDPNSGVPGMWHPDASIDEQLQELESSISYLMNNPDSFNGYLAFMQQLVGMGQNYGNMTPDEQKKFNEITSKLQGMKGLTTILAQIAIYGTFYKNGVDGSAATEAFANQLKDIMGQLSGLNGFFSDLSAATAIAAGQIPQMYNDNIRVLSDPRTGATIKIFIKYDGGPAYDFAHYVQDAQAQAGTLDPADAQDMIQNYYQSMVNEIMEESKGNPWEAMVMLLSLLMGQDMDMTRSVNGAGHTTSLLTDALNKVSKILNLLKTGNFSGPDGAKNAQDLMMQLSTLKQQIDTNPLLSNLAPWIDSSLNNIFNMQTIAHLESQDINCPPGIYTIPPGVTIMYINQATGQGTQITNSSSAPMQVYLEGGTIKLPAGTYTIGDLGRNDIVGGLPVNGIGYQAVADALAYLQGTTGMNDLTNNLTSIEAALNSPSASLNQQINNTTNLKQALESLIKVSYNTFGDVEQVITKNMQAM